MLQQEVKKSLQERHPAPPAGFEERSSAQVLRLVSEEKAGRHLPRAVPVVCTVLLVLGIATALASTVESINQKLHTYWPELAELLMPINAGCESLGIRMEVESAVVKDNTVIITYSLQDLEGDRLNPFTEARMENTAFPLADTTDFSIDSSSVLLSYDAETKKAVYAQEIEYNQPVKHGDYQISLRIPSLTTKTVEVTDLHPLLEQYGESAAAIPASEAKIRLIGTVDGLAEQAPENLRLLDCTRNPEIRIQEHVTVSGIGWIDGLLHVQLHYTDNELVWIRQGEEGYYPVYGRVLMQLEDARSALFVHREKLPNGICCVNLGGTEDFPEWQEYIFPCDPSEAENGKLEAQITLNNTLEVIDGNWAVKVPLRMIQYE